MVSSPKPESAASQAAAQSGLNRDTALTQQQINMINQVTPDGSLTYNQTGTSYFTDSKGNKVATPTYTATTTLSDAQKAIKAQTDAASLNLGTLANQQSAAIKDQLAKPFSYDNKDAENWAYDLASQRILPQQQKAESALRQQLISSGLRPGTKAYSDEMTRQMQGNSDQLNQLALTGRQQGYQEALTTYNNPLNSISALMSGSQVSNPTFAATPTASVQSPNYMQASQNNYAQQQQASAGKLGGLFGLLSGGIGLLSDARAKENIVPVGYLHNGLTVYRYNYKGQTEQQIGLLAQEVEKAIPHAVNEGADGFKRVRYDIATEMA